MSNVCVQCNSNIPKRATINGKEVSLHSRSYCLTCSPFGIRSKCGPKLKLGYRMKGNVVGINCKTCNKLFYNKHAIHVCPTCRGKAVRKKRKNFAVKYKGGECKKCGYSKCDKALVFHHIDPSKKEMQLSWNWEKSFDRIVKELDKCCLLCANCHAELHAGVWDINEVI